MNCNITLLLARSSACLMFGLAIAVSSGAQTTPQSHWDGGLRWRLVGPFRGGRALAVCGVPGSPESFYFGGVGGGVWKSENAGRTWTPIFDQVSIASIGAIAVAPSNPNTVYVGTGEADMRSDIQQGDGMYKSTDAGKTWTHIGLDDTRQIGKILVDPNDPNVVYVAALGHQYGPNPERGVFKTTDGGATWSKVLYFGPSVGAIDMAIDPTNSQTLFAALWQTRRPPWSVYPPSNGPGSALYKSTDGGRRWAQVQGGGFPAFVGRVGISISPADHNRIYACIDTTPKPGGGMYRSDDGGATWTHTGADPRIWGRGWYFTGTTADPKNRDEVYVMNTSAYRSIDGGKTFTAFKGAPGGDDYHTCWIAPDDPNRMILGSDQGTVVSVDGGRTWSSWYNQPTAQLYHVTTDTQFPYWIYGAQQDSGAIAVAGRTIHTGISARYQHPIEAGDESGTSAPDPLHPGTVYSSTGTKETLATGAEEDISITRQNPGKWRSTWTLPIIVSPIDPHVVYTTHQVVFRSPDEGKTWKIISPDLSREKIANPQNLDPVTAADHGPDARRGVVYWIAPSPVQNGEIWAGTDDGLIWLTTDEGAHWKDVTPAALRPWSKVGIIDASHSRADTAYAAVDRHRLDDNTPYIYRTHDSGATWTLIVNGLPTTAWVNVVREDPRRAGLLYAGTDRGVYASIDDGDHWMSLQRNLPAASVRDIVFGGYDIVIATHGRSIWIMDDPTILRQITPSQVASQPGLTLFKPDVAIEFHRAGSFGFGLFDEGTPLPPEEPQGENPLYGAAIDYIAPGGTPVELTINDSKGTVVAQYSSAERSFVDTSTLDIPAYWVKPPQPLSAEAGGHRYVWDLNGTPKQRGRRGGGGSLVPVGNYTVTLKAGSQSATEPLTVTADPRR